MNPYIDSNSLEIGKGKGVGPLFRDGIFIILILVMTLFFFRTVLPQGRMIGDRGDARLNNLIVEHWYKVFCCEEKYNDLSMFYPVSNTVSYTDMSFLTAVFYSGLRAIGFNMFSAYKIVLIGVHFGGSLALYCLLNKVLRLKDYAAFAGVVAFSFAMGYANRIIHTQMTAVSYLPLILIFLILTIKHFEDMRRRRIYLFLFLTNYALLAYTGWYTFYFSAVFAIVYVVVFLSYGMKCNPRLMSEVLGCLKKHIRELAVWAVYMILLLIPFLRIYLPTSKIYGPRPWQEISYASPGLIDIFNVGPNNLILGKWINALNISNYRVKLEGELTEGFSIVLLFALSWLSWKFFKKKTVTASGKKAKRDSRRTPADRIIIGSLIISVLFSIILVINISGVSLWWLIYAILPGASSLKAVARFYLFLLVPMGILLAILLDRYPPKKHPVWIIVAYTAFLWVSNISTGGMYAWNYETDLELLNSVSAPPEQVEVMAVCDSGADYQDAYLNQLDAWMIADYYHIKTVNGYSGMYPPGWPLWDVTAAEYPALIEYWKLSQGIEEDIWLYDRGTNTWSLHVYNLSGLSTKKIYSATDLSKVSICPNSQSTTLVFT